MLHTEANRRVVRQFLQEQELAHDVLDPEKLLIDYLDEMERGLQNPAESSLAMIPTYVSSDKDFLRNHFAVALDAGGTNLRGALVSIPEAGEPVIECFRKGEMPGLHKELSSRQFFEAITAFIEPLLTEYAKRYSSGPECLGFCFSYATEIVMQDSGDLDGKLLNWSKEIKVPELVGQYVGTGLLSVMQELLGSKAPKHIYVINDTVATLLAGKAAAEDADYSDFIGYIFGTGVNSCHAESCSKIVSLDSRYRAESAIVNVESGNYGLFPQSQIEKDYDASTQNPGTYLQEKSCSGRYWGELVSTVLRCAARSGIVPEVLQNLPLQNSASLNAVLHHPSKPSRHSSGDLPQYNGGKNLENRGSPFSVWLDEQEVDENSRERIYFLTEAMLDRNALFTSINIVACILRSQSGLSPLHPICLTIDGTTFYALHRFERRVRRHLDFMLSEAKQRKRYYRIKSIENAPLLGASIAALSF